MRSRASHCRRLAGKRASSANDRTHLPSALTLCLRPPLVRRPMIVPRRSRVSVPPRSLVVAGGLVLPVRRLVVSVWARCDS